MTRKAKHILERIRRRARQRRTFGTRERILGEFNQSTLDDVGPVGGGDQEMKVLNEMNELKEFENSVWKRE